MDEIKQSLYTVNITVKGGFLSRPLFWKNEKDINLHLESNVSQ